MSVPVVVVAPQKCHFRSLCPWKQNFLHTQAQQSVPPHLRCAGKPVETRTETAQPSLLPMWLPMSLRAAEPSRWERQRHGSKRHQEIQAQQSSKVSPHWLLIFSACQLRKPLAKRAHADIIQDSLLGSAPSPLHLWLALPSLRCA